MYRSQRVSLPLLLYCFLFSSLFFLFCTFLLTPDDSHWEESRTHIHSRYLKSSESSTASVSLELWQDYRSVRPIQQGCPTIPKPFLEYVPPVHSDPLTEQEKLLAMCRQTQPIALTNFFTETMKRTVTKIGDGTFADVYACQKEDWNKIAVKVIPIEGEVTYNRKTQNTFKSIQQELVISLELSLLGERVSRKNKSVRHYTNNFVRIERIALCTGKYPKFLMNAWDEFDFRKKADNDRPDLFPEDQLYVAISTKYSGARFDNYFYHSFEEFLSIMQQVSASLAVAEAALQFEHRDLHHGNVLVQRTHQEYIYFRLDGVEYSIKSHGVLATIVDYTLSTITQQENMTCTSFVDMKKTIGVKMTSNGTDTHGDLKHKTYKAIFDLIKSDWKGFYPRSNVLWMHYLTSKTRQAFQKLTKNVDAKFWEEKITPYLSHILEKQTAKDVFLNVFLTKN